MTHYYYYVQAGTIVDKSTRIYKVAVGTSSQAQRDYLSLVARSVDFGDFFKIADHNTSEFINRLSQSVDGETLPIQLIKARDLVRAFKAGEAIPLSDIALHQAHQFRNIMDTGYRIMSNLNREA